MLENNQYNTRIYVHDISIGMFISALDRPWLETPFLLQGFLIENDHDIKLISDLCEYVYIDIKKSKVDLTLTSHIRTPKYSVLNTPLKRTYETPTPTFHQNQVHTNKHSVEAELENAGKAYQNIKGTITKIIDNFKAGRGIDIQKAKTVVNDCVTSIFNNKDALMWFTLIKDRDLYTSQHSLNVAILSIAFGRFLGHSEKTLETIGLCGLLHDLGKLKIPLEILNKKGSFTDEEYEIMKQHPDLGREYLLKLPNIMPEIIDATYGHHEKMDGSGYPQGLKDSQISYYAKLVSITDAYDAITSDRSYQNRRTTLKAQKILYESAGSHFDKELVRSFIQWLGIYPPGSIIEMSNGEVGIVLSVDPNWKTKPCVIMLLNEEKNVQPQRMVDLYKNNLDTQGNKYHIKVSHPNNTFGINLAEFQEKGVLKNWTNTE